MSNDSESAREGFVVAAKANDIHEGSMVGSTVSGNPILISRIGGKFYAIDAVCSHLYGYLPKGELRGSIVVCPVHKAQYDIPQGRS
jgi:3-phenylpropionate/trans-cinnamate dioxygenase ferredoxin subunit